MMPWPPDSVDEDAGPVDPHDGGAESWFLPDDGTGIASPLPIGPKDGLVDGKAWRAAEAELAADLAALTFDAGRLAERMRGMGAGAAQRLALEEAASLSWWTGDRVTADRLALWSSYRIGAAEEDGGGLIRTAWAARRLMAAPVHGVRAAVAGVLSAEGRCDGVLADEVDAALQGVAGLSAVTRSCVLFHLWRALDDRPDHLRGLEAAVLGARLAGQGGLAFLPLALTGFGALTASGAPERRLAAWVQGAHRAVLSALMALERLAQWQARAKADTADLTGRAPARLIAALAAHPMLGAAEAQAETDVSRAAVQRNLELLQARGLVREVTGRGRFRVWSARV